MNYELAKQLKDAGFPQKGNYDYTWDMASPTLSELIEACGKEKVLWEFNGNWYAGDNGIFTDGSYSDMYIDSYPNNVQKGTTPEEAVAKLWLELNSK